MKEGTNSHLIDGLPLKDLIQGDMSAFRKIYDTYNLMIFSRVLKLVKSKDIAEEILQETFIKLWEKRADLDIEYSIKAYVFRIAENLVIDFFRKASRNKEMQSHIKNIVTQSYLHIEEAIYAGETATLLETAINLLPPKRREIFRLCKLEGKSYEEVSKLLGVSISTINDHIVKGTLSVKTYLKINNEVALLIVVLLIFR